MPFIALQLPQLSNCAILIPSVLSHSLFSAPSSLSYKDCLAKLVNTKIV